MRIDVNNQDGNGCGCAFMMFMLVLAGLVWMLTSCKSTEKIEYIHTHDTVKTVEVRTDSIDRWHTHYEYIKGDTVFSKDTFYSDRWRVKTDTVVRVEYKDRVKTETEVQEKKILVTWPLWLLGGIVFVVGLLWIFFERFMGKIERNDNG